MSAAARQLTQKPDSPGHGRGEFFTKEMPMTAQLKLGKTCTTSRAAEKLNAEDVLHALCRHARGDWGELTTTGRGTNYDQLRRGGSVLSLYSDRAGNRFYIITDAGRSLTTVLLPDEY